jgi:hypothetical protein
MDKDIKKAPVKELFSGLGLGLVNTDLLKFLLPVILF